MLVAANLEDDFCAVLHWLRVALVCSAPNSLSYLGMEKPTAALFNAVMLKQRYVVLIRDIPGLKPSVSPAKGSIIADNIKDLVTK